MSACASCRGSSWSSTVKRVWRTAEAAQVRCARNAAIGTPTPMSGGNNAKTMVSEFEVVALVQQALAIFNTRPDRMQQLVARRGHNTSLVCRLREPHGSHQLQPYLAPNQFRRSLEA